MVRPVSSHAAREFISTTNEDPFLVLLTLRSTSGPPVRVVNNNENIVSNGNTFLGYPFEIVFPSQNDQVAPSAELRIGNVDRLLVSEIRSQQEALTVDLQAVFASDPDQVEIEYSGLRLRAVTWDDKVISGSLMFDNLFGITYPNETYNPSSYPGLF